MSTDTAKLIIGFLILIGINLFVLLSIKFQLDDTKEYINELQMQLFELTSYILKSQEEEREQSTY